jgi:DnaJ-related protein SCJ1
MAMRTAFCSALLFLALAAHLVLAVPNCEACRKLIGVNDSASPSDIKKAYHQKALENHPDKNPDDPAAQERFLRIQGCYEGLIKRKCTGA